MEYIRSVEGLKANGHYALATVDQDRVYVSGQFSVEPETGKKKFGSIHEETLQVLDNIERILLAAGCTRYDILKTTVYVTDLDNWAMVNNAYEIFFGDHTPARAVVAVDKLHYGFKVEIEAVASREKRADAL